jgi:hypothetical protein
MSDESAEKAEDAVKVLNSKYIYNHDYKISGKDKIGPYTVYSVGFFGAHDEAYTNYAVTRDGNEFKAFHNLVDIVPYLDKGWGWNSLFIDQFGVVGVFFVIAILSLAIAYRLTFLPRVEIPKELWLALASGLGYLVGAKGTMLNNKKP